MTICLRLINDSVNIPWSSDLDTIDIGRDKACDLVVEGPAAENVSWRHCQLEVKPSGLFVTDLRSTNGTFVNGRRVETRVRAAEGDRIRLGNEGLVVEISRIDLPQDVSAKSIGPLNSVSLPSTSRVIDVELLPRGVATIARQSEPPTTRALALDLQRRSRRLAYGLVILVVGVPILVGLISWRLSSSSNRAIANVEQALMKEETKRTELDKRLQTTLSERDLDSVFTKYSEAIYLVGRLGDEGMVVPGATAFAVSPEGILATNAHVAIGVNESNKRGHRCWVISPGGKRVYEITSVSIHPRYVENSDGSAAMCPDVALLKVNLGRDKHLPVTVEIATSEELRTLRPGNSICYIGFPVNVPRGAQASRVPGNYQSLSQVLPRTYQGSITRIMTFESSEGTFDTQQLLEHDTYGNPGRSGSPLFSASGKVIGVHFSGRGQQGADSNAVRADLLHDLIEENNR